jgi:hypothetical protein
MREQGWPESLEGQVWRSSSGSVGPARTVVSRPAMLMRVVAVVNFMLRVLIV